MEKRIPLRQRTTTCTNIHCHPARLCIACSLKTKVYLLERKVESLESSLKEQNNIVELLKEIRTHDERTMELQQQALQQLNELVVRFGK